MILIQSNNERTIPHHFDCACAMYGVIESAQKYRLTSFDEIKSGKLLSLLLLTHNIAIGSVEFMHEVFTKCNIPIPTLPKNSNRESEIITLSEAIKRTNDGEKLFIKPTQDNKKLFTGFVLDKSIYSCLNGLPNDMEVLAYKPFDSEIITEWRCYVYKNEIYDMKNYSGEFNVVPNINYINAVLKQNTDFPIAYTADVGLLKSGKNVVIEFNDMYAIGNYGLRNDKYLSLLKERYLEITGRKCLGIV